MVKHHHKTNGKPRTIVEWIIHGSYERENSATIVLDSLVMRGILGRESKLFGRRYPTIDSGMTIIHCLINIFIHLPGVSIKFEVGSQFEKSRRLY